MLADKIDVTAFLVWFIENWPESFKIMKENPDYQFDLIYSYNGSRQLANDIFFCLKYKTWHIAVLK